MKKSGIKILAISCFSVMIMNFPVSASVSTPALGNQVSFEESIRESVISEYQDDPQFIMMKNTNEKSANEYIEMVVQKELNSSCQIDSVSTYGDYAYCYVPVISQSTTTNCSAATLLQTLYGLGLSGQVYGSTYTQKQATLYNFTSNSSAPGARQSSSVGQPLEVWEITSYLNSKINNYKYQYRLGSNISTESSFRAIVWNSLIYNRPILLHAKTGAIDYYNGNNLGHYLSLDCITNTGVVTIKDCNYNSSYGGAHYDVSSEEAWRSIHDYSYRYLISY